MSTGFIIRDSNGDVNLSSELVNARLVHIENVDENFSGTFSVPDFDDTIGIFTLAYDVESNDINGNEFGIWSIFGVPTLNWNNSSKVMTVTKSSLSEYQDVIEKSGYRILFLHYK